MSQKSNFSQFFHSLYSKNEKNNFLNNFLNNENSNIIAPLFHIESINNYTIKANAPININNIIINNEIKNNPISEYSDLAYNNKNDKNNNNFNFSKLLIRKKTGDTIDFKTKWKTEKCNYWEIYGECKFGENCAFAHGEEELKQKITNINYKTKLCKQFFEEGFCPYGSRCQFSHKKKNFNINSEKSINYSKIISNLLLKDQITMKVIKRPRLMVFENIVNSNQKELEENRLKLYLDIIDIKNKIRTQINKL